MTTQDNFHDVETGSVPEQGAAAISKHSFDTFAADAAAEQPLRHKIDWHIVPVVVMLYLFCFIDRANIGNARIAGLEKTLKMNPKSYYFLMAFVRSFGSAVAVRFLLGVVEAGMLPTIAFYLSRWYRKDELTFRLGMYISTGPAAGACGGLLASAILKVHGIGKVHTWEQIFLVEGVITMGLGLIGFFTLTESIQSARWLSSAEKALAEKRLASEMVGQKVLVDNVKFKMLWKGITSPTSLACALMFTFCNITVQGLAVFLPTIVKVLYPSPQYTVIQQQLLTVPPNAVGTLAVLLVAYASTKLRKYAVFVFGCGLFMLSGYAVFLGSHNFHVRYAGSFLSCLGAFNLGALLPSYAAANTNNDTERAGAIGVVVLFGNLGGLISTWTYLPKQSPHFVPGNSLNVAGGACISIIVVLLVLWQRSENAKREAGLRQSRLENKTPSEIDMLGSDHPDFRLRW
ncbi:hypothetical protein EX895_001542 [Sporisorium graminicola]|uniref:Major facilitator superfamily (MFS) profile domain-containing protein n=1 Tax=Sporisorium graminicola TaxID=280036 RepID=A0A4U7KZI8_9BASI|nr:hypothetical protein EX895_001542 [Sporisorium graminicola]TKY89757.1 hypothetical protein EX895_001542 [Sporisorium graminicola]